ncbi:TRAF3-interacting protein 1 [Condylostylus longicornis]|uniref:TRAF3-interacting protein 1 n=1 Tax=Condylostylus longicornis TaxID=2530218 RepID=UPI00244DF902|nr:TRAF3-interacting protein 1 [Condylostylus longicornis]
MAEEQAIEPAVIKKTQEILGKYVKKPPLTEKLLKKPPFRFLQDIVISVIKETGCLQGLYSKTELSSEGITDRNAKIAFLQKLIDVLKMVSNENITARPSKIVAGHEASKTNEMLQILGICLDKKFDFKPAIEKVNAVKKKDESKKTPDSKEIREKKVNEPKPTSKIKQISKNGADNKAQSTSKNNNKEKPKSTPLKKEKDKFKEKEKTKQAKDSKISTSKGSFDISEAKQLQHIQELETIDNLKESQSTTSKNDNESFEKSSSNKVPDQKKEMNLSPAKQEINTKLISNETVETTPKTKRIISANKQNLETEGISNENSLDNSHADKADKQTDKTNLDLAINDKAEKSPKNLKSKENRKSSGTQQAQNSSKTDFISTFNESTLPKEKDLSVEIQEKNHQKINENSEKMNIQKIKNNNSQNEVTTVTRQSTFTREESKDSNGRPRTSLRPPSVRPPSARPGAPKRRDKNIEIVLQPNDQIKLAGIQLKVESFNDELDDDGENLVIIENENASSTQEDSKKMMAVDEEVKLDENLQQGHLVQQILETQKELIQNYDLKEAKDEELDVTTIQKRQSSAKQMNSLRDIIQNLTRSINPLGKLMDFIPEDMDAMQLEMNMWRDLYSQTSAELKKEKSLTESAIEPMKSQLEQINGSIKEYNEMIDECRARILQNSEKIYNLLTEY